VANDLASLQKLSRDELIERAGALGTPRPELLTRVELCDEILRRSELGEAERQQARGWFGVARDLVASVVEQGLNLPDAAELIRGKTIVVDRISPPIATVTLAEIYASQGHVERALQLLDEVLDKEPEHEAARAVRERLQRAREAVSTESSAEPASATSSNGDSANAPTVSEPVGGGSQGPPTTEAQPAVVAPKEASPDVPVPDHLFVLRTPDGHLWCHWELAPGSLANLGSLPRGRLVLRLVRVRPDRPRPSQWDETVDIQDARGPIDLGHANADEECRVAVGWRTESDFLPLCVATDVHVDENGCPTMAWRPLSVSKSSEWEPGAVDLLAALAASSGIALDRPST